MYKTLRQRENKLNVNNFFYFLSAFVIFFAFKMADSTKKCVLDSDEDSDDDYVPDEKTGNVSEEADSGDAESELEDEEDAPKSKRRRKGAKSEEKPTTTPTGRDKSESDALDTDALWAEFKRDTEPVKKPAAASESLPKPVAAPPPRALPTSLQPPTASRGGFLGGGSRGGGGGLAGVLGKIGKKDKLSTLERSKLDWNNFKKAEGIEEEIQNHNKGKDGFLEKRDFLERTDMRQFELEKSMRTLKRSTR